MSCIKIVNFTVWVTFYQGAIPPHMVVGYSLSYF